MRKIVSVAEVEGEGLESLLGEKVQLWCMNYIYTGKLVGVGEDCVRLEDAGVVYETGALDADSWSDMQRVPKPLYVRIGAIESFSAVDK